MTDLYIFKAFGTALTGTIPTELGRATNLVALLVQETDLSGTMPDELCILSIAGTLQDLAASCVSDNSTGIPEPAPVTCTCKCVCYL
jgi:hypothetical protein